MSIKQWNTAAQQENLEELERTYLAKIDRLKTEKQGLKRELKFIQSPLERARKPSNPEPAGSNATGAAVVPIGEGEGDVSRGLQPLNQLGLETNPQVL